MNSISATSVIIDLVTKTNTPGPPLNTARSYHFMLQSGLKTYVLGGDIGNIETDSIEEYEEDTNTWTINAETIYEARKRGAWVMVPASIIKC